MAKLTVSPLVFKDIFLSIGTGTTDDFARHVSEAIFEPKSETITWQGAAPDAGFSDQGADVFFGEPELDTADLLRTSPDGLGVISCLELPAVQDRPKIFSTFLMWLLADLFHDLPEVGDVDKPKLVFFFDEAHLLFADASKAFLQSIAQTVRLIRSKGVGIFFVTQTPKDVPDDVLAQLGSRVQHQLRAHRWPHANGAGGLLA